jgi:hypothetical protein
VPLEWGHEQPPVAPRPRLLGVAATITVDYVLPPMVNVLTEVQVFFPPLGSASIYGQEPTS